MIAGESDVGDVGVVHDFDDVNYEDDSRRQ